IISLALKPILTTRFFCLKRKRNRQINRPALKLQNSSHYIKNIVPVESVPVKCIGVDSPSHLFLVGKSFVPTHNTTRDQAKIVWTHIKNLTKKSDFAEGIQYYQHNLSIEDTWSKCEPLSSDSKSLDGLDTSFASLDELHAHPNPRVHDLIVDSVGARDQPMVLIITTAGTDQLGICYQRREYLTQVLKKTVINDSFFGVIYTLDTKKDWPGLASITSKSKTKKKEDDWQDEDLWVKAMPGLWGVTASGKPHGIDENGDQILGYMTDISIVREAAQWGASNPAALNNFLCKRLNIWTQQINRWIDLQLWDQNNTTEVYIME
ncbi:hypothetical protein LCGC14_2552500, partial [marine sediment metagenome]